ncbi:hypothetical protein OHD37_24960 [Escherichia coli]|nr:hypothetical protein [Escherichia coli]
MQKHQEQWLSLLKLLQVVPGDTPLGSGGIGGASSSSFSGRGGGKAEGFGAGGGGACASAGSEAQSGGDGAPGIVIVEEYA